MFAETASKLQLVFLRAIEKQKHQYDRNRTKEHMPLWAQDRESQFSQISNQHFPETKTPFAFDVKGDAFILLGSLFDCVD